MKFDGGDAQGEFKGLKGLVRFDEKNLSDSKFEVTIHVATINTGNGFRNTHAKSAGWFDVEKYPNITFASSADKSFQDKTITSNSPASAGLFELTISQNILLY